MDTNDKERKLLINHKMSRRKAVGFLGLGLVATQIPLACSSGLSTNEKQSIHYLTLTEVAELIKSKRISSEELTQLILVRITALDPKLNSYITVMAQDALNAARFMDRELSKGNYRGPLHGVPLAVKDLLYTTNAPTTGGHSFLSNSTSFFNAEVVTRLTDAGAIILGKLNTTEGAMDGYSKNFKVAKNPWGSNLWTGVSSSGPGIATAAGLCFGSIGTDTGGSIRFPSLANGIVGLKPTYGLVSTRGVMPLAKSMDHIGPMCRSVLDAAVLLEVIAGYDPNDPNAIQADEYNYTSAIKGGINGLRIGVDYGYAEEGVEPSLAASIKAAINTLEELGGIIVPFNMPDNQKERDDVWFVICSKEAYEANKKTYPSLKAEYGKSFAEFLEFGMSITEDQYQGALQFKREFQASFIEQLSQVDALVAPAGGMADGLNEDMWRSVAAESAIGLFEDKLDLHFGTPANLAGIPALTLPCGKAENGFPPPGFQLMGAPLTEAKLCRIAYAYEKQTGWSDQHPDISNFN